MVRIDVIGVIGAGHGWLVLAIPAGDVLKVTARSEGFGTLSSENRPKAMKETLKHQRTTLTGTDDGLVVDVVYANAPTAQQATEYVMIRLPLRRQQYPKLAEARLESLLRVRDLAENETREIRSAEGRGQDLER